MRRLLCQEVQANFPCPDPSLAASCRFELHCSEAFRSYLIDEILHDMSKAIIVNPELIDSESINRIMFPEVGEFIIKVDMKQGYKIVKLK